jgi:DnaJ-domain-containing protein 1
VQRVGAQRAPEPPVESAPASGDAARRAADEAEVSRVLGALTDADALGLRPRPLPDAAKRAYRALAKRLHPDKCTAARASAAFQRILLAYQRLSSPGQ